MTLTSATPPVGVRSLRVPARVDDAVRALLVLAARGDETPVKVGEMCEIEGISPRFLSNVLVALRDHGLVHSLRGALGGYWLARPAAEITVADVYDAVDAREPQPLPGSAVTVDLWEQLESELRARLTGVTVADLLAGSTYPRAGAEAVAGEHTGDVERDKFDERCRPVPSARPNRPRGAPDRAYPHPPPAAGRP